MSSDGFIPGLVTGAVLTFFITMICATSHFDGKSRELNKVLVDRGYAEWVIVDPRTGKTEFKIKECVK
jgi:hypothetical protein